MTVGVEPSSYRDGRLVFIPNGGALPRSCVRCGNVASGAVDRELKWKSAGQLALGLAVGFSRQWKTTVVVPLCERHSSLYTQGTRLVWIGLVTTVASVIWVIASQQGSLLALIGIIGGLVLAIFGDWRRSRTAGVVSASRIDKTGVWLDGQSSLVSPWGLFGRIRRRGNRT